MKSHLIVCSLVLGLGFSASAAVIDPVTDATFLLGLDAETSIGNSTSPLAMILNHVEVAGQQAGGLIGSNPQPSSLVITPMGWIDSSDSIPTTDLGETPVVSNTIPAPGAVVIGCLGMSALAGNRRRRD